MSNPDVERFDFSKNSYKYKIINGEYVKYSDYKALEARIDELLEQRKKDCVEFFQWWWNQPGTNTEDGFDDWIESRNARIDK